jgi:integrase
LSHVTVKKEIGTFTSIWNKWGVPQGHVIGPAPTKGLVYRKIKAKPPFQTWQQIERQIRRGGLSETVKATLWESLFLSVAEVQEMLEHVKGTVRRPADFAMFSMAAFTGARRSEMLRSQVDDFDFDAGTVVIREKKRDRSKELTFRTVPLTPALRATMQDWFRVHPGGAITFCKRPDQPLKVQEAAEAFRAAVTDSKWNVLRGWHVLRHSFCSNCALKSLDQRIIDSWMGHQTEEMRRRYRHLFPNQQQEAIRAVFW